MQAAIAPTFPNCPSLHPVEEEDLCSGKFSGLLPKPMSLPSVLMLLPQTAQRNPGSVGADCVGFCYFWLGFPDLLIESAMTQAAPAIARQIALPAHAKCRWGVANSLGAHTRASKPTIMAASK